MDINVLAVSVGNSRLALGTFAGGELIKVVRVGSEERERWPEIFAHLWEQLGRDDAAVVGASVNPNVDQLVAQSVLAATNHDIQWAGKQIDLPIAVLTDVPEQTGVDRVLNIAAAYEQLGKACVVVDAGTAVTVDCCNDNGDFLGGAIAPGAQMMLNALHERTAQLPQVKFLRPDGDYGSSTVAAMQHGVFLSLRGLVRELLEQYATTLGVWPELIATGGDAANLFGDWELTHAVSPDLTLYGIALAYAEHHIKHGT